jgi:hypothetical protein
LCALKREQWEKHLDADLLAALQGLLGVLQVFLALPFAFLYIYPLYIYII